MKSRVVVGAIIEKDGKILMGHKMKDRGPYPNTWHIPGGGVHLGEESTQEAIIREIQEETHIEVTDLEKVTFLEDHEPDKHGDMTHFIFLIYRAKYKSGNEKAADDIERLQWVDKKDISKIPLTRPSQKLFRELGWI